MGFTRFYWMILGFTGLYCFLPGFTGFYRVLPGFYRTMKNLYWSSREEILFIFTRCAFTGFYWVLLDYAGFFFPGTWWVWISFIGFYRVSSNFASRRFTVLYQDFHGFYWVFTEFVPSFTGFRWFRFPPGVHFRCRLEKNRMRRRSRTTTFNNKKKIRVNFS